MAASATSPIQHHASIAGNKAAKACTHRSRLPWGIGALLRWIGHRPAASNKLSVPFLELNERYEPPAWAKHLKLVPRERFGLGQLPTPIHQWHVPNLPPDVQLWIKRDDLTGMQLSGNKVRKLEFLIAEAKRLGHDCVVTLGGIQSNHCRATVIAAKYAGLPTHLLLRTSRQRIDSDPGLQGNLLLDRLAGAHIHLVTKEEYSRIGSPALGEALVAHLRQQGLNPYLIPVGGSNALGTWGYLQAVEEIRQQSAGLGLTDLAMACGSGGTTAGLALGVHLSGMPLRVHAYAVCDTPDYFYDHVDVAVEELGLGGDACVAARAMFRAVQARGSGYAISTQEELATIKEVCEATGVLLDPVYSGKAIHGLLTEMRAQPEAWRGRRVLFVHTGGMLGMYDKLDQLQQLMVVPDTDGGKDAPASASVAAPAGTTGYGARVTRFVVPQSDTI